MPGSSRYASQIYGTMQELFTKTDSIFENPLTFIRLSPSWSTPASMSNRNFGFSLDHEEFEADDRDRKDRSKFLERDGKIVILRWLAALLPPNKLNEHEYENMTFTENPAFLGVISDINGMRRAAC